MTVLFPKPTTVLGPCEERLCPSERLRGASRLRAVSRAVLFWLHACDGDPWDPVCFYLSDKEEPCKFHVSYEDNQVAVHLHPLSVGYESQTDTCFLEAGLLAFGSLSLPCPAASMLGREEQQGSLLSAVRRNQARDDDRPHRSEPRKSVDDLEPFR